MASASTLTIRACEDIAPDYVKTLRRWRLAILDSFRDVRAQGVDDSVIRIWEFYLACCEAYFQTRMIGTLQMAIARSGG